MGDPGGFRRDYLAGSLLVSMASRCVEGFAQGIARESQKLMAWTGLPEALRGADRFKALCALLASAILANGITIYLTRKEIGLWGVALRLIGLLVVCPGLLYRGDWNSLRENSLLRHLSRFIGKRALRRRDAV